jgi:hypothetical protein
MTDQRWQRIKVLFQAAVERPSAERAAFVAAAAGDDDELRREVEALLESDAAGRSVLDRLPLAGAAVVAAASATLADGQTSVQSTHTRVSHRAVPGRQADWRRRHGPGVPRSRHQAES